MSTNNNSERCNQLHTLYEQLTRQIKALRESVQKAEQEGVDNPVETMNVIKSLEKSLNTTALQLQECPPEFSDVISSTQQPSTTSSQTAQSIRRWFPDSALDNEDENDDTVIDEY